MKYQASKHRKRKEAKINQLFTSMETYELDGPRYLNNLKDMLYGMLQSFVLTDVTLVCDDKRQFQAQKIYLSAKSFEINEISNQGKHVILFSYLLQTVDIFQIKFGIFSDKKVHVPKGIRCREQD